MDEVRQPDVKIESFQHFTRWKASLAIRNQKQTEIAVSHLKS